MLTAVCFRDWLCWGSCACSCLLPLVWTQAGVCGGQQRLQVWRELIQLHGEGGQAIVEQVILWLWICVEGGSQVICCD